MVRSTAPEPFPVRGGVPSALASQPPTSSPYSGVTPAPSPDARSIILATRSPSRSTAPVASATHRCYIGPREDVGLRGPCVRGDRAGGARPRRCAASERCALTAGQTDGGHHVGRRRFQLA